MTLMAKSHYSSPFCIRVLLLKEGNYFAYFHFGGSRCGVEIKLVTSGEVSTFQISQSQAEKSTFSHGKGRSIIRSEIPSAFSEENRDTSHEGNIIYHLSKGLMISLKSRPLLRLRLTEINILL